MENSTYWNAVEFRPTKAATGAGAPGPDRRGLADAGGYRMAIPASSKR